MEGSGLFTRNTCIEEYDSKKNKIIGLLTKIDGLSSLFKDESENEFVKYIYEFYNLLQVIRSKFVENKDEKHCDDLIELVLHAHAYQNTDNNTDNNRAETIKNYWLNKGKTSNFTMFNGMNGYTRMSDIVDVVQTDLSSSKNFSGSSTVKYSTKIKTFKYTKPSKSSSAEIILLFENEFSGAMFNDTFTKLIKLFIDQMTTYLEYIEKKYNDVYVTFNRVVKQISGKQETNENDKDAAEKIATSAKIIAYVGRN